MLASNWRLFQSDGRLIEKFTSLVSGFIRRFLLLFRVKGFDWIFIHREAAPVGPPIFEWFIARGLRKKIIYDFDDAIWLTDRVDESAFEKMLRWRSKVSAICRMSHRISCGNEFLANFARKHNKNVIINPTTIDMSRHPSVKSIYKGNKIVIGWTGSKTTLKYLDIVRPVITRLMSAYPSIELHIIADARPSFDLPLYKFVRWTIENEVKDLMEFDIGIMPLPDNDWSKGKCGFKALQYMSVGIPAVASPVGVNKQIIQHNQTGLLAQSEEDWLQCLELLAKDPDLRARLGAAGREFVRSHYSVDANAEAFLSLFT